MVRHLLTIERRGRAQMWCANAITALGARGHGIVDGEERACYPVFMAGKASKKKVEGRRAKPVARAAATPVAVTRGGRPSSLVDTRIIYCGNCLDQLRKLPDGCVDLIYIDPPFNSNRNYEVFWGGLSEPRPLGSGFDPPFEDRHAGTQAYIEYMRPRCVELARVLKKTGSSCHHRNSQDATGSATLTNRWS